MDWLISNSFAASRLEAVTLASMLMEENFLRPVGARSTGAIRSGDLVEQFLDDSTALYTFVSLRVPWGQTGSRGNTVGVRDPQTWMRGLPRVLGDSFTP